MRSFWWEGMSSSAVPSSTWLMLTYVLSSRNSRSNVDCSSIILSGMWYTNIGSCFSSVTFTLHEHHGEVRTKVRVKT